MHQIRFRRDYAPDPAGGAHDASPDPVVGWGGEYPFPFLTRRRLYAAPHSRRLWRRSLS